MAHLPTVWTGMKRSPKRSAGATRPRATSPGAHQPGPILTPPLPRPPHLLLLRLLPRLLHLRPRLLLHPPAPSRPPPSGCRATKAGTRVGGPTPDHLLEDPIRLALRRPATHLRGTRPPAAAPAATVATARPFFRLKWITKPT